MLADYQQWDPSSPTTQPIEELCAKHGFSKQTLYYEMRKRNLPLKGRVDYNVPAVTPETTNALLQLLVEARVRVAVLEQELERNNIKVP